MGQTLVLSLFAGIFAANATPHFVKGITKEPFPTPFGSLPVVNVVAGWAMLCLAAFLAIATHPSQHPVGAFASVATGVLIMGLFHAWIGAFGKK